MSEINADNIAQIITNAQKVEQHNYYGNQPTLPNSIPTISNFVGREDYLAELREAHQKGTSCFVLHGIGGVGKTATALQLVGEITGGYKAKILIDMRGMSKNPLSARDAMLEIVRQFEREVPADIPDAQLKSLYISKVQNQPTLIVLDNAEKKESVEALIQAKACFIVTSRRNFSLTDSKSKQILKMSPEDARKLLFENGGGEERFDGQADTLADLAGYLPMALKPLAALLKEDELETATDLIERYRDKQKLLKERVPDYDDLTVEASFELSYEKLPDGMKERWRRLSVFPSDFDEAAIAAVLDISANKAKETQRLLLQFSVLEVNTETRRFNLHDLVRAFLDKKLSEDERFNTQFLHTKYYALILEFAGYKKSNDSKGGFIEALAIIDAELDNIIAGQKWSATFTKKDNIIAELCVDYSGTVPELLALRLHMRTFIKWQEDALESSRKLKNKQYEAGKLGNLGSAYQNLGEYRKAIEYHQQQLSISQEIGNKYGESVGLSNLGVAYNSLSESRKAIEYYKQSLNIAREIGDKSGESSVLSNLGLAYQSLGQYQVAIEYHEQSLRISSETGDLVAKGNSLTNLGLAYVSLRKLDSAVKYYEQSLEIKRRVRDRRGEGVSLGNLGLLYQSFGQYQLAIKYHEQSLEIAREISDMQGEAASLSNLGLAYLTLGELDSAIKYNEQSLEFARIMGDRRGEGSSLGNLGIAYFHSGETKKACSIWKQALVIFDEIESPDMNRVQQLLQENCKNYES